MTSNQIQFASNEITKDVLAETNRHNTVSEDIAQRQQELAERQQMWKEEYDKQKLYIDKEYNDAYIAYLNASETEKEWYESELARIESKKAETDQYYKNIMAQEKQNEVELGYLSLGEQERSNKMSEKIRSDQNWLTSYQLIYDATKFNVDAQIRREELAQNLLKFYEQNEVEWQKLSLSQKQQFLQERKLEMEKLHNMLQDVYDGVDTISGVFKNYQFSH